MTLRSSGKILVQIVLCLLSAGMLFAAFPYLDLSYLAWFAFVPWFMAVENASRRRAFLLSFLTGIAFWGATVYWLIHVTLAGMIGMVLYLSLYFAAFGVIIATIRARFTLARVLFIPSVWVLLEFLRSHVLTGFPWALAAYTQSRWLEIIQYADITGVWGVSFLVLAVNVTARGIIAQASAGKRPNAVATVFTVFLAAGCFGYGALKLAQPRENASRYKIAVIQGNVPHEQKWREEMRDAVMETHLALTRQAAAGGPDLIVWSEAALPVILENEPQYFEQARQSIGEDKVPLLFGAITNREGEFFNSALLLTPAGEITGMYDKIHLVPFGEYIPLRTILTFLETLAPIGELAKGQDYTVFSLRSARTRKEIKFSTLICFEDLFPEMARKFVHNGADFLVNITNDAWYRYSPATYQHCQSAVFRAVENRVPVVRCANTGVSCFIDRDGRIIKTLDDGAGKQLFFAGYAEAVLPIAAGAAPTVYNRYGDYFIWACWFFVFIGAALYFADKL